MYRFGATHCSDRLVVKMQMQPMRLALLRCKSQIIPFYTIRSASVFKSRAAPLTVTQLGQLQTDHFQNRSNLTPSEWQTVRETLLNNYKYINQSNVDAVILGICSKPEQLSLAKDYVRFLNENGIQPNQATLGRLLRVYNAVYHKKGGKTDALTVEEQEEIIKICEQLKAKHEILDGTTCENIIHGLVATSKWLEARTLLDMMKVTSTPSLVAYTELVIKSFSLGNTQLGWQLLDEMIAIGKNPKCESYLAYLNQIKQSSELEPLFLFLERNNLFLTVQVAERIMQLSQQHWPDQLNASLATVDRFGKCSACKQNLQNVSISDGEFESLRSSFLEKVLIRNDVFQKSSPEEVERFKKYVEETAPYDCVIDGLNVAYSMGNKKPPHELAKLVVAVVHYFKKRHKHVLVLGRKHMNNWSKNAMHYVHKNASVFLTNDLSHDDPFLLYATLKSGPTADFFSRDLMRTHAYLLGAKLKPIFHRWQQEHQYSLITQTSSGQILVKEPIRYQMSAHKIAMNNTWHIPCHATYLPNQLETFEVPEKWLCVK